MTHIPGFRFPFINTLVFCASLTACVSGPQFQDTQSSPPDFGKRQIGAQGMVSSASPLASEAGLTILQAGGNAVDAAVATAFAIGVVEPQMSGVGGSGAMLIWNQATENAEYLNFYAAQPVAAFRDLEDPGIDSATPLRIIAVPGNVAGLLEAHERFGVLSRSQVMAPAIRLAENGFPINQVLAQMIAMDSVRLSANPNAAQLFLPNGRPLRAGSHFQNPTLVHSLTLIAEQGRDGFYRGETAEQVVSTMNGGGHPITLSQLASYEPQWMRPVCGTYRERVVLSAPPPQTGIQIIHTLKLLEPYDLGSLGYPTQSSAAFQVLTSALRAGMTVLTMNDDPNWGTVPANGITSDEYADGQAPSVGTMAPVDTVLAGVPGIFDDTEPDPSCAIFEPYGPAPIVGGNSPSGLDQDSGGETTHISVVDQNGNAVALTQTNSSLFGSRVSVGGFMLNNSGFRFDAASASQEGLSPWRIRISTISPTIILEDGRVKIVVGAPGSGRIPTAIVQAVTYTLDYGLDPLDALRMPRLFPSIFNRRVQLEHGFSASTLAEARANGYEPDALSFGYARLYMIVRDGDRWIGVADPRHDGEVRGY